MRVIAGGCRSTAPIRTHGLRILLKYPLFSRGLLRPPAESSMTANIKVAERKCYINGQFVGSGRQFAKINPVDGTVVAQVHEADRAMVDAAVRAARAAPTRPCGRMALQGPFRAALAARTAASTIARSA